MKSSGIRPSNYTLSILVKLFLSCPGDGGTSELGPVDLNGLGTSNNTWGLNSILEGHALGSKKSCCCFLVVQNLVLATWPTLWCLSILNPRCHHPFQLGSTDHVMMWAAPDTLPKDVVQVVTQNVQRSVVFFDVCHKFSSRGHTFPKAWKRSTLGSSDADGRGFSGGHRLIGQGGSILWFQPGRTSTSACSTTKGMRVCGGSNHARTGKVEHALRLPVAMIL